MKLEISANHSVLSKSDSGQAAGVTPPPAEEQGDILLRVAQEYLRRRLQAVAPGALLTLFWEEFYGVYGPMVAGTVRHYLADRHDADDVIQEIWLTVARRLPDFQWRENRGGFRAWMTKLIHNKTMDLIRRKLRRRLPSGDQALPFEPIDEDGDPGHAMDKQLQRQAVRAVLGDLRPHIGKINFCILRLHYWKEKSVPAIASQLGLTSNQVQCRLHRLLRKLRRRLAAYFPGR